MNTVVSSYVRSAKSIDLGGTGFFRLVGLLAGACANFAVIAILSRDYGVEYYAFYALILPVNKGRLMCEKWKILNKV